MIPALVSRGFGYGSGVINPPHDRFIVNIPKNASSYILDWASRHGWRAALAADYNSISEVIVILRDPVERWISGISQYICTYIQSVHGPNGPVIDGMLVTEHDYFLTADLFIKQYTDLTERLFIDAASRFDDHVWPQSELIKGLLPAAKTTYFYLDNDLNAHLAQYLGFSEFVGVDRNQGSDNPEQKKIQEFFQDRLLTRPELKQRLMRHYQDDYDLIGSVEFYGSK
jgi:hypothetical protein